MSGESRHPDYVDWITAWAGRQPRIDRVTDDNHRLPIWTFTFADSPAPGQMTVFTYGLSDIPHERWRAGRPELILSVMSADLEWSWLLGAIVKQDRARLDFSWGTIKAFDDKLTNETAMSALLAFMPVDVEPKWTHIELKDRVLNLVQMYPIYEEEMLLIQSIGPRDFLMRPDLDHLDVRREAVRP